MRSREELGEIERGMGNNTEGGRDMGNSEKKESGREMRSSEDWGERDDCNASLSPKHALTYTCYSVIVTTSSRLFTGEITPRGRDRALNGRLRR